MKALTVFMVEDSPQVRDRIREMLADIPAAQIVGDADSEAEALLGIMRTAPKLVILDINLKSGTGFEVLRQVKAASPGTIVAVLTNFSNSQFRKKCAQLGADHFFDKTKNYSEFTDLLHQMGKNSALFDLHGA